MSESASERGRRVAELRLRSSTSVEPLTPTSWSIKSLRSEIDTLNCINNSKDQEIQLLRKQLAETTKVIEKTKKQISILQNELCGLTGTKNLSDAVVELRGWKKGYNVTTVAPTVLLESFSQAPSHTLQRVLGSVEKSLGVSDVYSLPKAVERMASFERNYEELFHASCQYLRVQPEDMSHASVLHVLRTRGRQTMTTDNGDVLREAVK